jgi:hypothetical protein
VPLKSALGNQPGKAGPGVARPAQARQAPPKCARDSRREKRLNVVEPARGGVATRGVVQRQKPLPALPRCSGVGIVKQISFRCKPQQDGHGYARGIAIGQFPSPVAAVFRASVLIVIFEDELRHKHRAVEIRERIAKVLRGVHSTQCVEIFWCVFAYSHRFSFICRSECAATSQ